MNALQEIEIKNLDHLGIIAGLIDETKIVKIIDQKLGIDPREKISGGQVVKALILNALGMVSRPLYLFSQFFEDKPLEKLLGKGIKSEYLNDDKIGRVMDKIYQIGLSELFVEIVLSTVKKFKIETEYAHLDATSFHLHGEYKNQEIPEEKEKEEEVRRERPILITRGYSRDHRPDLKQCILDLVVSNDGSLPLFMRTADGNESDKAMFGLIAMEVKKQLNFESVIVSDSALYSRENLQLMEKIKWISRVPRTVNKAKEIIERVEIEAKDLEDVENAKDLEEEEKEMIKNLLSKGYNWKEEEVTYGSIEQRWLVVESEQRKKSDLEKLETKIEKEEQKVIKAIKKLEQEKFEHPSQVKSELKRLNKKLRFFQVEERKIIELSLKKGGKEYKMQGEIQTLREEIEKSRKEAGRFIVATNILDKEEIKPAAILQNYQNQQRCERGFGFLKDPMFFADSFFVEKPERIETILFLMSLSLLVYNLGQREMRNCLKRAKSGIKNQLGKSTQRPTLRWIFQCFQGIHILILNQIEKVVNLTEERKFILQFLPSSCQKYYLSSSSQ